LTINNITNAASVRKILIVDDEAEIVSIFKMILEMNDFEVDGYTNPESALFNFKPNEFGLLILDIRMPIMNGFDLFKKMKVVDSKVVACFITPFEDYREEFKGSSTVPDDANCFIRKPKAIEDLVNHVATILR
jgi:two-component system, OmpR family, response regulator ChvI